MEPMYLIELYSTTSIQPEIATKVETGALYNETKFTGRQIQGKWGFVRNSAIGPWHTKFMILWAHWVHGYLMHIVRLEKHKYAVPERESRLHKVEWWTTITFQ
jgi:hypothetical protein